jgi:hypothetical protein
VTVTGGAIDPRALTLEELRQLRARRQHDDDAISFVRRLAQGRLDVARAKQRALAAGEQGPSTDELSLILSRNLSGGAARPPRPADDFSDHPLAAELDDIDRRMAGGDVEAMDAPTLRDYAAALEGFEHARSEERREVFAELDALSAELVRRYREGEADVDTAIGEG